MLWTAHLKQLLLTNDYERDKITQNALREVRNMKNPFQYGGVVSGDAFCNRKQEVEDLLRAMENGEKLFVYSERRFGKTSLVRSTVSFITPRAL